MQPRIWRPAVFLMTIAALALWRAPAGAQAPAQNNDVLAALLTEVRALRVAMEQMASAGPRVQLAMGRLQLQEQRVNNLVRQLDSTRGNLSGKQRQAVEMRQAIADFEEASAGKWKDNPEERQAIERQVQAMKVEEPSVAAEIVRLQADEASLSQQLAAEQGRWSDINRQLEDLERSLARKP